jgi:hypothetical protein
MDRKEKTIVYTAIGIWTVWVIGLVLLAHYVLHV